MTRTTRIVAYAVTAILGLMGAMKFMDTDMSGAQFVGWGYPAWFALVIGAAEVATAVLLAIPRTRFLGALAALVIMAGAIVTHLRVPEVGILPLAVMVFAAAAFVAMRTRPGSEEAQAAVPA